MKYIIENKVGEQWWRFSTKPFLTEDEAKQHIQLIFETLPHCVTPATELRVAPYTPATELRDLIADEVAHLDDLERLEALISLIREETIINLINFDAVPTPKDDDRRL